MGKKVVILVIVLVVIIGGFFYFSQQKPQEAPAPAPQETAPTNDEQAIRNLISQFGDKMKTISLLAPKNDLVKSIEDNYGPYISPELLAGWRMHPEWAPGRLTSSPWPSGINILSLEYNDDGSYEVQGKIMEMTSAEEAGGGEIDSGQYAALKIRKQNNKWVITGFTKAVPQQQ